MASAEEARSLVEAGISMYRELSDDDEDYDEHFVGTWFLVAHLPSLADRDEQDTYFTMSSAGAASHEIAGLCSLQLDRLHDGTD